MKIKSFFLISASLFVLGLALSNEAQAGTERATTSDPVFTDGGNSRRVISVAKSTVAAVLISSANTTTDACKGGAVGAWRGRTIINTSDGILQLLPSNSWTAFSSSFSVVLGSDTVTPSGNLGDSYTTDNQGAIWGIWSSSTTKGGAGGEEEYWCQ